MSTMRAQSCLFAVSLLTANAANEKLLVLPSTIGPKSAARAVYAHDTTFPSEPILLANRSDVLSWSIDVDLLRRCDANNKLDCINELSLFITLVRKAPAVAVRSGQSSISLARPSRDVLRQLCMVLHTSLPWLPLASCDEPHSPNSVTNLHRLAPLDPSALSRSGSLTNGSVWMGRAAGMEEAHGAPMSDSSTHGAQSRYAREATDEAAANLLPFVRALDPSLPLPLAGRDTALAFGAGLHPSSAGGTAGWQHPVMVTGHSLRMKIRTDALCIPSFFRPTRHCDAGGVIASILSARGESWQENGLTRRGWESTSLHVTLAQHSQQLHILQVATAETARFTSWGQPALPMPSSMLLYTEEEEGKPTEGLMQVYHAIEGMCKVSKLSVPDSSPDTLHQRGSTYMQAITAACKAYNALVDRTGVADGAVSLHAAQLWMTTPLGSRRVPPTAPLTSSRVCRRVSGRGFHHDVVYDLRVSVTPTEPLPQDSLCRLAAVHHLPAGTYMDLDELRTAIRDEHTLTALGSSGGAGTWYRSFGRFIDVEAPSYRATQHTVITAYQAVAASGTVTEEQHQELLQQSSLSRTGRVYQQYVVGGQLTLTGSVNVQIHKRYPTPGCRQGTETRTESYGIGQHSVRLTHYMDGSVSIAHTGWSWWQTVSVWWARMSSRGTEPNARALLSDDQSQSEAARAAAGQSGNASSTLGLSSDSVPFLSGCYHLIDLPLPQLHISCSNWSYPSEWLPVTLMEPSCTPEPVPPMPTGRADDVQLITSTVIAVYVGTAALLACAALYHMSLATLCTDLSSTCLSLVSSMWSSPTLFLSTLFAHVTHELGMGWLTGTPAPQLYAASAVPAPSPIKRDRTSDPTHHNQAVDGAKNREGQGLPPEAGGPGVHKRRGSGRR